MIEARVLFSVKVTVREDVFYMAFERLESRVTGLN